METNVASPLAMHADRTALGAPPAGLYEAYRRQLATTPYAGAEQRCEPRHAMAVRVVAVPLNGQGEACGAPFVCLTSNISASGLALLHTSAIREKLLDVELDEPNRGQMRGVLEVLRCRSLGDCFEIAGRFVQRPY